jgi:hypothetical protein
MGLHTEILSLALLVAIALAPGFCAAEEAVVRPRVLPGGVASPDGGTGFLTIPDDGVRVVDLRKGANLGRIPVEEGLRPLIATDKAVVTVAPPPRSAQRSGSMFSIAMVDSRTMGILARSQGLALPKWVPPLDRKPAGDWGRQSIRFEARLRGDQLLILWEASQRPSGGIYPADAQGGPIQHSGAVVILRPSDPSLPVLRTIPLVQVDDATLAAFDRPPARFAAVESLEYGRGGARTTAPLLVAGKVVVFGERRDAGRQTLVLRTFNPADPTDETTLGLMTVRGGYHSLEVTLDGRHLLVDEDESTDRGAPAGRGGCSRSTRAGSSPASPPSRA